MMTQAGSEGGAYRKWSEGLTEDAVAITGTRRLDDSSERYHTSLLYGDRDVVAVIASWSGHGRIAVSDAGEGTWTARVRHLGGEDFSSAQRDRAEAIASRHDVEFLAGEVVVECPEAERDQAIRRVALASQEIEAAASRWD